MHDKLAPLEFRTPLANSTLCSFGLQASSPLRAPRLLAEVMKGSQTYVTAMALEKWVEMVGISSATAWRWRKRGFIRTTNICGRQYVLPDDHAEFLRRAAAGDFAIQAKTPRLPQKSRIEDIKTTTRLPTVVGDIPLEFASKFVPHAGPGTPEFMRLPKPRERDQLTGASRSWIIEFDDGLPLREKLIVRVRQRGKLRGVCFIDVSKYLSALHKASTGSERA